MSDRHLGADLLNLVNRTVMHPNFSKGDRVVVNKNHPTFKYGFPEYFDCEFVIDQIISEVWLVIINPQTKEMYGISKENINICQPKCQFNLHTDNVLEVLESVGKVRVQPDRIPVNHHIVIKKIKDNYYKYARWRTDGVYKSHYLCKCTLTQNSIK